jgi:hypothetical protein
MANFNLNDYETVEQRLHRAYKDHPDMRVITKNLTTLQDRQVSTWVVQAEIWLPVWDFGAAFKGATKEGYDPETAWVLKATGLAFEIDGVGMAQKTAALETCESSAIGRALANAGYSGNRRTTREEMAKAERGLTPAPTRDWLKMAEDLAWKEDLDGLRALFVEASRLKASEDVLNKIKELGNGHKGSKDSAK